MPPFTNPIIDSTHPSKLYAGLILFIANRERVYEYYQDLREIWFWENFGLEYDCRKELAELSELLCTRRTFNLN